MIAMPTALFRMSACIALLISAPLLAQQPFPHKPIRIVVPFSPGGGGDFVARKVAARLGERTGVSVVVDNRAGASGNLGAELVVRSTPDGYTILSTSSTYGIQASLGKQPFDPIKDVTPIIAMSRSPAVIIVRPASSFRTLQDLIDAAKKQPGHLTYGTAGVGAIAHMNMEHMASVAGIRMTHVPYKGSSQALTDMLGGNIDVTTANPMVASPLVRSGRVRALAVGGNSRLPTLPDVPTYTEAGLKGFDPFDWKALIGPKGMPAAALQRLNSEVNAIVHEKEFASALESDGSIPLGGTPADLLALLKADVERWRTLVRERQIKVE